MKTDNYDIAIIGGGPGGIATALEAAVHGIQNIILIDKADNHSSTIRKFYKENKRVDKDWKGKSVQIEGNIPFMDGTKESTLDFFDKLLDLDKIDTLFNTEVESIIKDENEDEFLISTGNQNFKSKAVVVAIGKMGKPNKPEYKIPPSIKAKVNFNLDGCSEGEKILVVGGGNSAAEYAYELADENNNVTLVYRKAQFTRLNPENEEILRTYNGQEKLRLRLNTNITSLENEKGKIKVNFDDGYFTLFDRIIYAIGGTSPIDFLKNCGIKLDSENKPIYNEHYMTNILFLYVAGDIAFNTGGSIAASLNHGYHIVNSYMRRTGKIYAHTDKVEEFLKNNPEFK
ncbi:FAD-dependent pyridine nucleotide-disulfide oxidoreductase [Arcobacter nitrofigilis DSM 7299]|uniref:FAD-dependent pyridine nucleotide-disulfide oxidoreductase n=1 Tax=Arcobacter nitrofigilis (strain ATCC 33309 / DSM 7299 / CCUG 15893 / LMG 7604 / NCTC 12251 / CI) TaxID=572480 RepID=D5V3H8_ARCNC|nr:NAD(P)-binding domain-containing protein [Arcobacter nitrofigilis]ADG91689.1 FAD-dependent pyridine nucleotide-disulfide oxidoreductase [Arcobacter nitrofigilis DSM 7299]